ERVEGGSIELGTGLVEFGCRAVVFGDGEVGPYRLSGRHATERHRAGRQRCHQRIEGRGWQHGDGVKAGQGQRAGDVDAFAAGFGGNSRDPVYRTACERPGQCGRAVDAGVGGDRDDHATTTSTPPSTNCLRSAALISESVIRVSTLEIGAKLTKSSRPTF